MRSASISNRAVSLVSIVAQIIRRSPAVPREKLKRIAGVAQQRKPGSGWGVRILDMKIIELGLVGMACLGLLSHFFKRVTL